MYSFPCYIICVLSKETYCDVMIKYKSDLAKPFDEATTFLNSVEAQLTSLCGGASGSYVSGLSLSLSL